MAKQIQFHIDEDQHEEWTDIKEDNDMTWEEVMRVGIETIKKSVADHVRRQEADDDR